MDHTPWLLQFITHSVYSVYVGKKSCEFYNNVSAVYWLLCTAASFTESAQPHHFLTTSKFHQALDYPLKNHASFAMPFSSLVHLHTKQDNIIITQDHSTRNTVSMHGNYYRESWHSSREGLTLWLSR